MSSNFFGNSYQPYSLGMLDGNFTDPYAGTSYEGIPSWSLDSPMMQAFTGSEANKLRDFNSKYGSTITGGLQGAAGLWGAYNGMQQNKLVKQQMANSLNQWNKNYANQVASYNTRLEDRQNARVAAQGAHQQDTASYMAKNRLK